MEFSSFYISLYWHGPSTGGFWTDFQRGGKTKFFDFFSLGASATKRFARSIIVRYGLRQDILSRRQKAREGGALRALRGLHQD